MRWSSNPTLEVPPTTSPKIALAFAEIRRKLLRKLAPAPAQALEPAVVVFSDDKPKTGGSAWPWIFGVAAVAVAGVSVWGWAEVASFESLKSSSSPTNLVAPSQALSAQSSAQVGEPVGIIGIVAFAGLTTGLVLTW